MKIQEDKRKKPKACAKNTYFRFVTKQTDFHQPQNIIRFSGLLSFFKRKQKNPGNLKKLLHFHRHYLKIGKRCVIIKAASAPGFRWVFMCSQHIDIRRCWVSAQRLCRRFFSFPPIERSIFFMSYFSIIWFYCQVNSQNKIKKAGNSALVGNDVSGRQKTTTAYYL